MSVLVEHGIGAGLPIKSSNPITVIPKAIDQILSKGQYLKDITIKGYADLQVQKAYMENITYSSKMPISAYFNCYRFDTDGTYAYITTNSAVYKINMITGQQVGDSFNGFAYDLLLDGNGFLYVLKASYLYKVNVSNMSQVWVVNVGGESMAISKQGNIFVVNSTGYVYKINSNGVLLWSTNVSSFASSIVINDNESWYTCIPTGIFKGDTLGNKLGLVYSADFSSWSSLSTRKQALAYDGTYFYLANNYIYKINGNTGVVEKMSKPTSPSTIYINSIFLRNNFICVTGGYAGTLGMLFVLDNDLKLMWQYKTTATYNVVPVSVKEDCVVWLDSETCIASQKMKWTL